MKVPAIVAFSLMTLSALSVLAQDEVKPPAPVSTASELAAILAKLPAHENQLGVTVLKAGRYHMDVNHRAVTQTPTVHPDGELIYVLEGSGTMVTGGKLVDAKRLDNGNWQGSAIEGGVPKDVSKGDWLLVPEGTPHQITNIKGSITMMEMHVPPVDGK